MLVQQQEYRQRMRGIPQRQARLRNGRGMRSDGSKPREVPEQDGRRDPIRKMETRKESNKVKAPD